MNTLANIIQINGKNVKDSTAARMASLAPVEASTTATVAHAVGEYFWLGGVLCEATDVITVGDSITVGKNCKAAVLATDVTGLKSQMDVKTAGLSKSENVFWGENSLTISASKKFAINVPAGTYDLNIGSLASTDTDSTKCLVVISDVNNTTLWSEQLYRVSNISRSITLTAAAESITLYASDRQSHSAGDTLSVSNITISQLITDITLSVKQKAADAYQTGIIKKRLNDFLLKNEKIFFDQGQISGTKLVAVDVNIPAGTYNLSIGSIVSSDSDSTTCLITFSNAQSSVFLSETVNRGATNRSITLSEDCYKIIFYAGRKDSESVGDTLTYNNVKIVYPTDGIAPVESTLNVLLMGDSIFGNDGQIAEYLGSLCNSCVNGAFGGTQVSPRGTSGSEAEFRYFDGVNIITALCNQTWTDQDAAAETLASEYPWIPTRLAMLKAVDMSNVDLLIMDWGTNDYNHGVAKASIVSAYETVIDLLQTAYPSLRILITTPIWRYWGTALDNDNGDTRVVNDATLKEIASAIETMCHDKRISVLNAYQNLPLSYATASTYFDAGDSTHLNSFGNHVYAYLLHGKIRSMY